MACHLTSVASRMQWHWAIVAHRIRPSCLKAANTGTIPLPRYAERWLEIRIVFDLGCPCSQSVVNHKARLGRDVHMMFDFECSHSASVVNHQTSFGCDVRMVLDLGRSCSQSAVNHQSSLGHGLELEMVEQPKLCKSSDKLGARLR